MRGQTNEHPPKKAAYMEWRTRSRKIDAGGEGSKGYLGPLELRCFYQYSKMPGIELEDLLFALDFCLALAQSFCPTPILPFRTKMLALGILCWT